MNFKAVPIPEIMRHLPLDARGYPIFFGAYVDQDGIPHFTTNDEAKRAAMIAHDLCSICGKKLLRGRWFVGGPQSAFHERGCYIDMPTHDECVHYALQVCPYLAAPRFSKSIAETKAGQISNAVVMVDPTMIDGRPPLFVAVMAVGQKMVGDNGFQSYVKPSRPYRKVEFWRHGSQLSADEGKALSDAVMNSESYQ
jgi:hypothetical protein